MSLTGSLFDILMETRKVERQISEEKERLDKSQQELVALERDIINVQDLQLKASSVLKIAQTKSRSTDMELISLHKSFNKIVQSANKRRSIPSEKDISGREIDEIESYRDQLKRDCHRIKEKCDGIAQKLNEVDLQLIIQKKKNAATLLRLKKSLEECLDIEKNLTDKLNTRSIK